MSNRNPNNQLSFYLLEPEKEIQGVEKTIILPRSSALESGDHIQRNMGYLIFTLSKEHSPKRVFIQTLGGTIVIYVTENFLLGAVLNKHADITLVDTILKRGAASLEKYFERLKPVDLSILEEKISKRGDRTPG